MTLLIINLLVTNYRYDGNIIKYFETKKSFKIITNPKLVFINLKYKLKTLYFDFYLLLSKKNL